MTNMVITPRQHQGECPENPYDIEDEICKSYNDCEKGETVPFGHGKIYRLIMMTRINLLP